MNLRAMVRYGVTAHQAMVTATSASGTYLNEPVGQVAPGMLADLAMLAGNPLEDITRAADVKHVMVNGYLHDIADLTAPFAGAAPAAAQARTVQNRMLAPKPLPASEQRYWWHQSHYLEESKRSCCAGG
jgi:adenine deaminase